MDEQQKIMAMMVLAEDQQKAAQTTLDALAQQVGDIERRATAAVRAEVQATMHSIEQPIVAAFKNHGNAIERAIEAAREATEAIHGSVKGVSWKLALVAFLAALGALIAFILGAYSLVTWQTYQVRSLNREKAVLVEEVAALKASAADFANRAGKAQLSTCGDKRRLCIKIDKNAGSYGDNKEAYAIIKGY